MQMTDVKMNRNPVHVPCGVVRTIATRIWYAAQPVLEAPWIFAATVLVFGFALLQA